MKKVKVGLIGFGSVGERHYNNLLNLKCSVAILTKRKDIKNNNIVHEYKCFLSHEPYDLIIVSNETYLHFETIMKVVNLKPKVIFVEKPLALNLSEVKMIEEKVKKSKISLIVGYSRQFYKPYMEIKKFILSKKLGQIYFLRISVGQHLSTWRKRDYRKSYSGNKRLGGSLLFDLVHEINFPAWALEEKLHPLTAVLKKLSGLDIDSEDIAESLFESERGSIVSIHQDFLRRPAGWSCQILGSSGWLRWDSESTKILVKTGVSFITKSVADDWNNMFIREMRYVLKVLKNKKPINNIGEAYADIRNILKIYEIAK